jgi:hypothetical protein
MKTTQVKYITKEYFDSEIKELKSDIYVTLTTALKTSDAYHEKLMERHMGALQEGFLDKVAIAMDGIKMLMEKSENHEERICKIEKGVI